MTAELWLRKPCQHGNLRCFVKTPLNDNLDPPLRTCPGGSEERLDPERVVALIARTLEMYTDVSTGGWDEEARAILDALGATDE